MARKNNGIGATTPPLQAAFASMFKSVAPKMDFTTAAKAMSASVPMQPIAPRFTK